jgi:rhodanese-related sulfurtransferase
MVITHATKMGDLLENFPVAKEILFERFHIGGCSSCAFSPNDTLGDVVGRKGISDIDRAVTDAAVAIMRAQKEHDSGFVSPIELRTALESGAVKLIDVRREDEHRLINIDGDVLATQDLVHEMQQWPKNTAIVLYCHRGDKSPDALRYLTLEHGFTNVKALRGGIDAWAKEVDPFTPIY